MQPPTPILAGLEGIRARLPLPPLVNVDPSELPEDERGALQRLPQNLEDALDALRQDTLLSDWLPPEMLDCHIALKTSEIAAAAGLAPTELCARYAAIY
jgi:glutamine synthetase